MKDPKPDQRLLKSYVWCKKTGKCYFVSTILRESSAQHAYGVMITETIVWEFDWDNNLKGDLLYSCGDGPAFQQHAFVAEQFFRHGEVLNV